MSHFIVNIILPKNKVTKREIEKLLSPYDEGIEVQPYIVHYKYDAMKIHTEELNRLKGILDRKDENYELDVCQEQYEKLSKMTVMEYYNYCFEGRDRDNEGNILSTYNPNSKWDWWQIGGRWAGWLLNIDAQKAKKLKNNSCSVEHAIKEKKIPFALITPDGKWLERGKMGWWGIATDELPDKEWETAVLDCYSKYPGHMVVQIDCHI